MKPEPEPLVEAAVPSPPSFLDAYACDEWNRLAPELHRIKLLTVADTMCFAAYCTSYSRWRTAEELLQKGGSLTAPTERGITTHPLVKISRDAAQDMLRYASAFGLTPVARTHLAAGTDDEGKFGDLLA